MLETYRVVDLTDERGQLAAFILAGLGADVVLVEPPDGSGGRRRGPFAGDVDDRERSLTFWGWNRGKRSVVLDLTADDGRRRARRALRRRRRRHRERGRRRRPRRAAGGQPGAGDGVDHRVRIDGPEGRLASHRSHGQGRRVPARHHGRRRSGPGAHGRAPGVPPRLGRCRGRRPAGPDRARHQWVRASTSRSSAQRSMMQATQSYVLAVPLGGTAAQRKSGGVKTGGLDVQLRVAVQGRLRVRDVPVRRLDRTVQPAPDAVDPRGGLLRRGHPGQGLARLRQPALRRPRADRGVRPAQGHRRRVLRHQDQGRAARRGVRHGSC